MAAEMSGLRTAIANHGKNCGAESMRYQVREKGLGVYTLNNIGWPCYLIAWGLAQQSRGPQNNSTSDFPLQTLIKDKAEQQLETGRLLHQVELLTKKLRDQEAKLEAER
jgi:hypothetical protein